LRRALGKEACVDGFREADVLFRSLMTRNRIVAALLVTLSVALVAAPHGHHTLDGAARTVMAQCELPDASSRHFEAVTFEGREECLACMRQQQAFIGISAVGTIGVTATDALHGSFIASVRSFAPVLILLRGPPVAV
jgi:hypothetical protein